MGIFVTVPTKSAIKKAIKKKRIYIDGIVASTSKYIAGGEEITLLDTEHKFPLKQIQLPLDILFEDQYLAVIYKPAGILVSGNKLLTITNGLAQNLIKSKLADAVPPKPVHRLDYATSGVLLVGKTASSITLLNKLFENKQIKKTYVAVTIGTMKTKGTIDQLVDFKKASTTYKVVKTVSSARFGVLNLVELHPKTGRKHQLRKHLSAIGNPILGDPLYTDEALLLKGKGLYLHALSLSFTHPFTSKKIAITKHLPKKYGKIFD